MLKVSIYIPCYNVEKWVARCIEGVLRQTHRVDEILIIDDGCQDRTIEIASQYPVRTVRHERNRGLAAARNTGFRNAGNELVAALDADLVPEANWLENLVKCFEDEKVGGAGGRLVEMVLDSVADKWRKAHMTQDWGDSHVINPPFMFGNNSIIRKSVVQDVGWYDERFRTAGEDADLSRRIRAKGYNLIYEPGAVVRHFRHDSVGSILDAYWRYWRFGSCAYFGNITLKAVLRNLWYSHFRWHFVRVLRQDWRYKNYELLWLDVLLLMYMPYRDLRLFLNSERTLNVIAFT